MTSAAISQAAPAAKPGKRPRDVRLDVFRGLCLIIIFIAHVWDNPWALWIPARFGFSDATEIFVFCSGMASAIAFGGAFKTHGFLIGTARILFRCWQVYWCHIGVFLAAVVSMIVADRLLGNSGYIDGMGVAPMFSGDAKSALLGLLTLTYVPNFFDILPMYLVILALLPIVVGLYGVDRRYAAAFVGGLWIIAAAGLLELPAEPWGTRAWFFNPFSWQLVFFTGFAFMSGWLPAPIADRRLIAIAALVVIAAVPVVWWPLVETSPTLINAREAIAPLTDKTHFGVLRYLHFLSLAYLAYLAVGEGGSRLTGPVVEILRGLGQQSLAIFMSGLVLSFTASTLLNVTGRNAFAVAVVNLAGIVLLIGIARLTGWFKAQPWQTKGAAPKTLPRRQTTSADEKPDMTMHPAE